MGVSGSGKSTVARALAECLGVPFCEGDDVHPPANVAKMKAGQPLDDTDRAPWLAALNAWMYAHRSGGVVSCSALRRRYRDRLRDGLEPPPAFVLLDPPREVLEQRMAARQGHFMPGSLLDSQLATLERPDADENALMFDGNGPTGAMVEKVLDRLAKT
jgi:gluconokinase